MNSPQKKPTNDHSVSILLKSDTQKYQSFIDHDDLRFTFTPAFIQAFFSFLDQVAKEPDTDKQYLLLENPEAS
jgi:hypothetical protein